MEFKIKKSDVLRELNLVQGVVEKKGTIPILSNLLIEASKENLSITATDLEVSIICHCTAEISRTGSLTVSAKKLFDIVRLLPESEISFKLAENEWLVITCEKSLFKLVGLPKDNFPLIPASPWTKPNLKDSRIILPGSVFRKIINRTIFATSQEESRYALSGALMILKPHSISMVTTDGHRLALITKELEVEGVKDEVRVLIPKKTLSELLKLVTDDLFIFGSDENHLFFDFGSRSLVSRLLTGQFPNYEAVIPKNNDKEVILDKDQIESAIRRAEIMADERSHAIKFILSQGQVEVTSSSSDLGEAKEVVAISPEASGYDGAAVKIGFNAQYLLDFLGAANDKAIAFAFKNGEAQVLFKPATEQEWDYQYVVMPMRL